MGIETTLLQRSIVAVRRVHFTKDTYQDLLYFDDVLIKYNQNAPDCSSIGVEYSFW